MDHNPYTAPQTTLETSTPAEDVPRPIAVWILSIILFVLALFSAFALAGSLWTVATHSAAVRNVGLLIVDLVWRLALLAIMFAAAYGAFRRRRWARWFGVLLIVAMAIFALVRQDTTFYATDAERAGGMIGRFVLFPALLAWWAYAFAFSAKARRYFAKSPVDAA